MAIVIEKPDLKSDNYSRFPSGQPSRQGGGGALGKVVVNTYSTLLYTTLIYWNLLSLSPLVYFHVCQTCYE